MGIIITTATGRGPYQLFDILEQIGNVKEDRFSILCNGGIIIDNLTKEVVDSSPIHYKSNRSFKLL